MSSHSGDAAREPGPAGAVPAGQEPDFRILFEALPGAYCVLDPDLVIVAATDAYLRDTRTGRAGIVGRPITEVFPDRPDPRGIATLRASLEIVRSDQVADTIVVDRYDIPAAGPGGEPDARFWSLVPAAGSRPAPSRAASSGSRRTCWPCRRACSRATGPCRKPTSRCAAPTTPRRTSSTGSATSSAPRCTPSSASASCSAWTGSAPSTGSGSP
jgi:hypothetical protein